MYFRLWKSILAPSSKSVIPSEAQHLAELVAAQPAGQEIHVIADNLSAHKTARVEQFLKEHPHVKLHFTPTYSSWLNQVELWLSKIERDLNRARNLHFGQRPGKKDSALHSPVQPPGKAS